MPPTPSRCSMRPKWFTACGIDCGPGECLGQRMDSHTVTAAVAAVIAKAPQWIRHDLAAKDPALRQRAEESLHRSHIINMTSVFQGEILDLLRSIAGGGIVVPGGPPALTRTRLNAAIAGGRATSRLAAYKAGLSIGTRDSSSECVAISVTDVTCAAPDYLAKHGVPLSINDLSQHRAVTYFSGRGRRTIDWHLIDEGKDQILKMRPAILVNDSEAFVACALAGPGLIQAIGAEVEEHLASSKLVEVLEDLKAAHRPVSIMNPNRQHLPAQVRAFIDWISALFNSLESEWICRSR